MQRQPAARQERLRAVAPGGKPHRVVVEQREVETAGSQASARDTTPVPDGAETLDLSGKTIMPGLVNLHVHNREGEDEIDR